MFHDNYFKNILLPISEIAPKVSNIIYKLVNETWKLLQYILTKIPQPFHPNLDKVTRSICPQPGRLYSVKHTNCRSWKNAFNHLYAWNECLKAGLWSEISFYSTETNWVNSVTNKSMFKLNFTGKFIFSFIFIKSNIIFKVIY